MLADRELNRPPGLRASRSSETLSTRLTWVVPEFMVATGRPGDSHESREVHRHGLPLADLLGSTWFDAQDELWAAWAVRAGRVTRKTRYGG